MEVMEEIGMLEYGCSTAGFGEGGDGRDRDAQFDSYRKDLQEVGHVCLCLPALELGLCCMFQALLYV